MKKSIALHFIRSIYIYINPDTDLLSTSEKLNVKIHLVNMIPCVWRSYVSKGIVTLKRFEQSYNLNWYFNKKYSLENINNI